MTPPSTGLPPTRWELAGAGSSPYSEVFEDLIRRGEDIDGEARLLDALAPRHARVLDAGAGIGRVAAAMAVRGHDVTAVEKDPFLVARSRAHFPDVPVLETDLLALDAGLLEAAGRPTSYDVIAVVGNVMVYLAEGTESRALRTLGDLLAPGGRILVGFHPQAGPRHSRDYPADDFRSDVEAAGLALQLRLGSYELAPPSPDYLVAVLGRP